mmetsp:Transcript_19748/g.50266  ORF Transcript_19748/g.50266 Transcript_19748/m.50266 type:complete len:130 (-) Transcript_19748:213-602(-)
MICHARAQRCPCVPVTEGEHGSMHALCAEGGWIPQVDMCEGADSFILLVDVPGLKQGELRLSRSGSLTKVMGARAPPYKEQDHELQGERPYGSFVLSVRVPERYQKRWSEGRLTDGVLRLRYAADNDDA